MGAVEVRQFRGCPGIAPHIASDPVDGRDRPAREGVTDGALRHRPAQPSRGRGVTMTAKHGLVTAALAVAALATAAPALASPGDLKAARAATAGYHMLDRAKADGYGL